MNDGLGTSVGDQIPHHVGRHRPRVLFQAEITPSLLLLREIQEGAGGLDFGDGSSQNGIEHLRGALSNPSEVSPKTVNDDNDNDNDRSTTSTSQARHRSENTFTK
jgi:hypothetical protein